MCLDRATDISETQYSIGNNFHADIDLGYYYA